ncbi:MAG TPA: hypothetical protein PK957_02775 [Candidatus Dojkabacteria bacterium]|nr:hypothetical protein [Candidatus Dojkabacteria bacterium]
MNNEFPIRKKLNMFDVYLIAFFLFILFSTLIASLMEYGIINGDLGPIHRYISNFSARLIIVLVGLVIVLSLYFKKWREKIKSIEPILFLVTLALLSDALGNLFGYYAVNEYYGVWWYDKFVHFINPALLTIGIYLFLSKIAFGNEKMNNKVFLLLSVTLMISVGALWEISEYFSDKLIGTWMVGGIDDSMWDLFWNTVGTITGGIAICTVKHLKFKDKKLTI